MELRAVLYTTTLGTNHLKTYSLIFLHIEFIFWQTATCFSRNFFTDGEHVAASPSSIFGGPGNLVPSARNVCGSKQEIAHFDQDREIPLSSYLVGESRLYFLQA